MPSKYAIGALVLLAILGGSGFVGWTARGWYQDHKILPVEREERAQELAQEARQREAIESMLDRLQRARIVQKEITHEIVKIPNPDRECLDVVGVRLVNSAATGTPPATENP